MIKSRHHRSPSLRSAFGVFTLLLFILRSSTLSQPLQGSISLTIITEKQNFIEGECVWIDATIKNLTPRVVVIPYPYPPQGMSLTVRDNTGKKIDGIYPIAEAGDFSLDSRGQLTQLLSLDPYCNDQEYRYSALSGHLLAGDYTIQARIRDVSSDSVSIHISVPPPAEREIARSIMARLDTPHDFDQAVEDSKELIKKFPQSAYLPDIYRLLLLRFVNSKAHSARHDELMSISLEFLDKYQSTGFAINAVNGYLTGLQEGLGVKRGASATAFQWQQVQDGMAKLDKRYSNARVSRFIKTSMQAKRRELKIDTGN